MGNGVLETVFYGGAVNYLDDQGRWQRIDPTLVPAADGGGSLRSKAGPVSVELPAVLGAAPVRVSSKEASVAFTLRDATGVPQLGVPAASTALEVPDEVKRSSATYANALPGVDVSYVADVDGVKEELVLDGPKATATFDFAVSLSEGMVAAENPDGGVDLVDGAGTVVGAFDAPFAYDQTFAASGSESGYTDEAVSLRIASNGPDLMVRLALDPAWLGDPARVFPVVVDPTLRLTGSNADTTIRKAAPDTNYGSDDLLALKGGSDAHRILYRDELFSEPVNVLAAEVQLYMATDTSAATPREVSIHEMSTEWLSGQATWNQRKTGVNWATPGGDYRSPAVATVADATGLQADYIAFPMRAAVQAWVDGERPNHGVMIKYTNETSGAALPYGSVNNLSVYRPRTVVAYTELAGVREPFSYEEFDLGAAGQAYVHLGNGNLTLEDRDLSIAGTGLSATLDRFYQSDPDYLGSAGARWRMWPGAEERLYFASRGLSEVKGNNGDVKWQGGPDELLIFSKRPDGSYESPHGYRATLSLVTEGTAEVFKLAFHETGVVYSFDSQGYLRDIVDRNANKLSFAYTCDTVECYLASMTDTQGRVTTFERADQYRVTKATDPAGRVHAYGYGTTSSGDPILLSYTDPAGKVTRYEYDSGSLLARVIDANGNVTAFAYDGGERITSLTRITDPAAGTGPTWRFDHTVEGQTKVTDPRGNVTTHYYDGRGRVNRVVDALGHERKSSYDSSSNVTERTSATGNKTIDTYDPATSNLMKSQLPTGAASVLEYTNSSFKYFPTKVTNPQGNALSLGYDTKGNLESVTDSMATPSKTVLTYNANGTVATSTDPRGKVTTYGYDSAGNLTTITPPAPLRPTTITYDGLSRIQTVTDGKGQVTTTSYDALDRPIQTSFAGGLTVSFGYDAGGRLTSRTDATGTTTYTYDALNRLKQENLPGGDTNAYDYDGVGNLTSMTDVAGTVSYRYNAVNLVDQLTEPGGAITTFGYDNDDNRTSTTYPTGWCRPSPTTPPIASPRSRASAARPCSVASPTPTTWTARTPACDGRSRTSPTTPRPTPTTPSIASPGPGRCPRWAWSTATSSTPTTPPGTAPAKASPGSWAPSRPARASTTPTS